MFGDSRQRKYMQRLLRLTLTFMDVGARAVISLFMRSAMPGNMVVPAQMKGTLWPAIWRSTPGTLTATHDLSRYAVSGICRLVH